MVEQHPWGLSPRYLKAFKYLLAAVFGLIVLGGSVRVMNAGLACPDWPLCFGDVIPDYHPQVYFEFIHRVVAGLVSLLTVTLLGTLLVKPLVPKRLKALSGLTLFVLATQVVMGGLTVLLQLQSKVVALHLGLGTGFFCLLIWIYSEVSRAAEAPSTAAIAGPPALKRFAHISLLVIYLQVILGGLVASHYAALVCTDFPTCHGQWFPTFSGIIGLHVIHRLGAYVTFATVLALFIWMKRSSPDAKSRKLSGMLLGVVCMQIAIGIANVLLHTPPLIAVLHLAFATKALAVAVRIVFATTAWQTSSQAGRKTLTPAPV